jgi:hypothetical protein
VRTLIGVSGSLPDRCAETRKCSGGLGTGKPDPKLQVPTSPKRYSHFGSVRRP